MKSKKLNMKQLTNPSIFNQIRYLEGNINYSNIYFNSGIVIKSSYTLSIFEMIFRQENFARIHKKYLINLNYIDSIQEDIFKFKDGETKQASRRQLVRLRPKIKAYEF